MGDGAKWIKALKPHFKVNTNTNIIFALLASNDFEETIRNAVSFGSDTDTIACIAGSMAEALYGIPNELREAAINKLPDEFNELLDKGYSKVKVLKK